MTHSSSNCRSYFTPVAFLAACASFLLTGCGPDFGEKYVVNNAEVYYKDGATEADAQKLAKTLERAELIDGKKKSFQLARRGNVWQFRIATANKSPVDQASQRSVKRLGLEISSDFAGAPVEVQFCDQKLQPVTTVKTPRGKKMSLGETSIFYHAVTLEQAEEVAAIIFALGFTSSPGSDFHISDTNGKVKIKLSADSKDANSGPLKVFGANVVKAVTERVFPESPVEFVICDRYFSLIQ